MSLYPLELKLKVLAKRLGISLHLVHPPHLVDHGGHPLKGVNARYHGDLDGSGTGWVVRAAIENVAQLQAILTSGVKVIALIEKCDTSLTIQLADFLRTPNIPGIDNLVAIELGNEIDLTGVDSYHFWNFLDVSIGYLRGYGYIGNIITGGISLVRPDTLKWLKNVFIYWYEPPKDLLIGIHRYSIDNDATIPQLGYVSREEECNAILEVANGRRIAITEFGYPLLDGSNQTDIDRIIKNYKIDLDYFSRMGASYAIAYQWLNGPTNTPIDRFGIRDLPQVQALLRDS